MSSGRRVTITITSDLLKLLRTKQSANIKAGDVGSLSHVVNEALRRSLKL